MTVLAETYEHLVEYDQWAGNRLLMITQKFTGYAKTISGPKIASDFRDCLKTHSPERSIATWLRIMRDRPWEPVYKPLVLTKDRQ